MSSVKRKLVNIENIYKIIPEDVRGFLNALHYERYETYIVGGAVRDLLVGIEPKDFDLATSATPSQIHRTIKKFYPEAKIDFVGASFGVMIVDGIEIATFRGDIYDGSGNDKAVQVIYTDNIKDDLARRDLTINAIAINADGVIVDPFNGRDDLREGLIRFVGDASQRINEDYNRIIRACRFIAKMGFAPTGLTAEALWKNRKKVRQVAPERIRAEILKAMELETPSVFFGALQFLGILEQFLPELSEGYLHTGGKWHPESVWEHNMLVGDSLPKEDPILRLAGFLHDIGKPQSWQECIHVYGEGKFINHHKIGSLIIEGRLGVLKFSKEEIDRIKGLTATHMFFIKELSPKAQRKLLRKLDQYNVDWRDLVRLRIADHKGNVKKNPLTVSEIAEIVNSFTQVEETPRDTKSLSVSGGQLIKEFQLEPGPIVGELQKQLLEFVLETGTEDEDCLLLKSHEILEDK